MQREKSIIQGQLSVGLDILISLLAFPIAYHIKTNLLPPEYQGLAVMMEYGWIVLIYMFLVISTLFYSRMYTFERTLSILDIMVGVLKGVAVALAILTFLLFVLKVQTISRLLVFIYGITSWFLLVASKVMLKYISSRMRKRGYNVTNILICGTGPIAESLIGNLNKRDDLGYRIIGCIDVDPDRMNSQVKGINVLGTTEQLPDLLERYSIDEVFFAIPSHLIKNLNSLVYSCEEVGVRANIVWDLYKPAYAKTVVRDFLDVPILTITATPFQAGQLMIKRAMDLSISLAGLIVLSPLYFFLALLVILSSKGPVIFAQERSGLNGRRFQMYKFRTMIKDAEDRMEEVQHLNEMNGPVFKSKVDPRITGVGRVLRNTSLDELPQLFNVLKGEMSLVGPRPPIPSEVIHYERWQRRRLSMKPGITCFWQIKGRNEVDFDDWMKLDLHYIDNWSIKLDIIVLLNTIPVLFSRRGAA